MGVIFVAGIYGVGKSTLCNRLSKVLKIPYYSAGDLISQANGESYGANKVVKDKNVNQDILSIKVNEILVSTSNILLAGHFCIFNKEGGVDLLPEHVFRHLHIDKILLLEAYISRIKENLSNRDNKDYSLEQIKLGKDTEKEYAFNISKDLNISLIVYNMKYDGKDADNCLKLLNE